MSGAFMDRFDAKQQKKILAAGRQVHLPEGWAPISEHTSADKLYIIVSGEVSVRHHGKEVARLGAGEVMGEKAIVSHTLRTASLVALTELNLIHLTDDSVRELSQSMPEFRTALEEVAASRTK